MPTMLMVGQVWNVWVPFSEERAPDEESGKRRPVVLLGWALDRGQSHDLIVVPSSTFGGHPERARSNDLQLLDFQEAGLSEQSRIRCSRVQAISPRAIPEGSIPMGLLSQRDTLRVVQEVSQVFNVQGPVRLPR